MKLYIKQVKRHKEVWGVADTPMEKEHWDNKERRVRVCTGHTNYGRLYAIGENEEFGQWLNNEETTQAHLLFKEIREKYANDPVWQEA